MNVDYPRLHIAPLNILVVKNYGRDSLVGEYLYNRLPRISLYERYRYEPIVDLPEFVGRKRMSLLFTNSKGSMQEQIMSLYPEAIKAQKLLQYRTRLDRVPYLTPVYVNGTSIDAVADALAKFIDENQSVSITDVILDASLGDVLVDDIVSLSDWTRGVFEEYFIRVGVIANMSKEKSWLKRYVDNEAVNVFNITSIQVDPPLNAFSISWRCAKTHAKGHFDFTHTTPGIFRQYFAKPVDNIEPRDKPTSDTPILDELTGVVRALGQHINL